MKRTLTVLGLLLIGGSCLMAQDGERLSIAGQAGAPMRLGCSARGIGMGNALSAVTAGNASAYYNPALAAFQESLGGDVSLGILSLDRRLNFLNFGTPLPPKAGVSLAIINSGVSDLQGRDNNGRLTDTYSTSENAFLFSFANKFSDKVALGVSLKILYYSLFEDMASTTVGFDIGALYTATDELTFAAVVQDVNSKYHWNSTKVYQENGEDFNDKFPLRKRLGAAYRITPWETIVSGEAEWIGSEFFTRFGAEAVVVSQVTLRAGIDQLNPAKKADPRPSVGFSIRTEMGGWHPSLHYTYVFEPYAAGYMHYLSIEVRRP